MMSSNIEDPNPKGGDGPNRGEQSGGDKVSGASGEHRQDEGRGEGGDRPGDDAPKTASKGINPVQHSE